MDPISPSPKESGASHGHHSRRGEVVRRLASFSTIIIDLIAIKANPFFFIFFESWLEFET